MEKNPTVGRRVFFFASLPRGRKLFPWHNLPTPAVTAFSGLVCFLPFNTVLSITTKETLQYTCDRHVIREEVISGLSCVQGMSSLIANDCRNVGKLSAGSSPASQAPGRQSFQTSTCAFCLVTEEMFTITTHQKRQKNVLLPYIWTSHSILKYF